MRPQPIDVEAVARLAAAKGIDSENELARLSGIPQSTLWAILNQQRRCYPSKLLKLAEALDVDPDDILAKESA